MTQKWVYTFGDGKAEGTTAMRNLLGGKGANLAEMCNIGLPVPPGFTINTEVCTHYYENKKKYPGDLKTQVDKAIAQLEKTMKMGFGDAQNPLLLSVRSGARVSMPGMMDTVLNLGLNDQTVLGLAQRSGDERFAYDSYRRFIEMYGDVVLGVDHHHFEDILDAQKHNAGTAVDTDLTADDLKSVVALYKKEVEKRWGNPFPQDVQEQLWHAIDAVFHSWETPRAVTYRRINDIPGHWGTAVNVQVMVFGNMGDSSATGVAFTRDPSTGENIFYGEYLVNAQGEDVVAGIRTPQSLTVAGKEKQGSQLPAMEEVMPDVFKQLDDIRHKLEKHYRDMQDIEFTVQQGKLWMLQTRGGKRTAAASLKIAVDMAQEKLITQEEAVLRVDAKSLDQLLHPTLDPKAPRDEIGRGLPASPGAASGKLVLSADVAEALAQKGEAVVLARTETSPEDIHGMHAAKGILTTRGGMTSHAAVVARGMGRPCVAGAGDLRIDYQKETLNAGDVVIKAGEMITLDGASGQVFKGKVPTIDPELSGDFNTLMAWADKLRTMRVRTNAETPQDAKVALQFGAEGIGLCRTEHMFFDGDRIVAMRQMIMAQDEEGRRAALAKILPMQREDFVQLFDIMDGLPVTIRLLDPPLHEFLPHKESEIDDVAKAAHVDAETVKRRMAQLHEQNPMLGHRGCRLAITYPEICEMQSRAIFEAAVDVAQKSKAKPVLVEVMIPLVFGEEEFNMLREVVEKTADAVFAEKGQSVPYMVGTMIELPRAALRADHIAKQAEFFSFGTNDLTQTTMGLSRDDAGGFLGDYQNKNILVKDPFVSIDQDGVGELVDLACQRGRATRPDIKLGICGEHGGDPDSIGFFQKVGLDYVSCSPYRVPIARLAAAQASVRQKKEQAEKKPKAA